METFADVSQGCETSLCVHKGKMFVLHRTPALFFLTSILLDGRVLCSGDATEKSYSSLALFQHQTSLKTSEIFFYVSGWGVTQIPTYAVWSKRANSLATHRGAPGICQKNYGWWEKLLTLEINSFPKETLLRREKKSPPHKMKIHLLFLSLALLA